MPEDQQRESSTFGGGSVSSLTPDQRRWDGRWKYPPYPNNWSFRPTYHAPLGMRQEPKSGVAVLLMAPPEDCFALSMSQQEAGLGAFYLSLWGKDVKQGQPLTSRPRLVFGKGITEEEAVQKYAEYLQDLK